MVEIKGNELEQQYKTHPCAMAHLMGVVRRGKDGSYYCSEVLGGLKGFGVDDNWCSAYLRMKRRHIAARFVVIPWAPLAIGADLLAFGHSGAWVAVSAIAVFVYLNMIHFGFEWYPPFPCGGKKAVGRKKWVHGPRRATAKAARREFRRVSSPLYRTPAYACMSLLACMVSAGVLMAQYKQYNHDGDGLQKWKSALLYTVALAILSGIVFYDVIKARRCTRVRP